MTEEDTYTAGLGELRKLKERLAHLEEIAAASPTAPAPLTFESLKKLDRASINRRWEEVQAVLVAGPTPPAPPSDAATADGPWPWRPPTPPAADPPPAPPAPPGLTVAEIRKMTPDAINADWDRVSEVLKGSTR